MTQVCLDLSNSQTWDEGALNAENQRAIEELQTMRQANNILWEVLFEKAVIQDGNIKNVRENVSGTLSESMKAVKLLAETKKAQYGFWKCILYGAGGSVVAGVAGLASSVPVATAAAGGAIVAGGSRLVYSKHASKLCDRELKRLDRLREQIRVNYEMMFTPDCDFPEDDDLGCDSSAVAAHQKILEQGRILSAIRYQLIEVLTIVSKRSPTQMQVTYPELEKLELQYIQQYKQHATDTVTEDNQDVVLEAIAHNASQDLKIAENISGMLPRQIEALTEIELKIAEAMTQLSERTKEVQKDLDNM